MENRGFCTEEIYDAALDSESLAGLPRRLAEALGGRSALVQWQHNDGSMQVLTHCGYFSDQQLMAYATEFAPVDPWIKAAETRQPVNSAMDMENLVSLETYQKSAYYNDFIRSSGDDTCRGVGVRIQTAWGTGMAVVHRGLSQDRFEESNVAALDDYAVHLRRMLSIQGRFSSFERENLTLQGMIDAMADAALLVSGEGRVLQMNAAAENYIRQNRLLVHSHGRIEAVGTATKQLRIALASAAGSSPSADAIILGYHDGRPAIATVSPLKLPNGTRAAMLLLRVNRPPDKVLVQRLSSLFGLTPAEAEIAAGIGGDRSLQELAEARQVSLSTIRTQLKQITSKMGCNRQSQIASVVRSIIPG
ncbi:helix-turn-helix transcriptional regulator [Parasphingorhabdus sp.]|uniref:helix-turn-helix transcriptional regulator n=1 Tax=Parasphingorhabdus sp. TaxID=2709688 RepID=UPI003001E775